MAYMTTQKTKLKVMKLTFKPLKWIVAASLFIAAANANAQGTVMVGGAAMYPTKDIIENAVNSKDHTTLVAAVKAAGLVETLKSEGPFTVFAPTNAAFNKLPNGTVDGLLKPEAKGKLTDVLTYHVVAGRIDLKSLLKMIKDNGGSYTAKTVQGGQLTFMKRGKKIMIKDSSGRVATVTIANVFQKNGVIHVINTVLLP